MLDWTIGRRYHAALALTCTLGALAGCSDGTNEEGMSARLAEEVSADATPSADSYAWPADCDEKYKFVANDDGAPIQIPARYEGYRDFFIEVPWAGRSVQMVALRPLVDNKKIVHHFVMEDDRSAHLAHWSPGSVPNHLPEDVGMYLPAKGKFKLQIHYYNRAGTAPEADQSGFELCVTRTPRRHTGGMFPFIGDANAPAGRVTTNTSTCTVSADTKVRMLAHGPHMHKLGAHAKLEVVRADGTVEVVHDGAFRFEEQQDYPVDLTVQTGDRVRTTCVYDNQTARNVGLGMSSDDEMCFNFVTYYPRCALHCRSGNPVLDALTQAQEGDCASPR